VHSLSIRDLAEDIDEIFFHSIILEGNNFICQVWVGKTYGGKVNGEKRQGWFCCERENLIFFFSWRMIERGEGYGV